MEYGTMNDEQKQAITLCTIAFIAGWILQGILF